MYVINFSPLAIYVPLMLLKLYFEQPVIWKITVASKGHQ